MIFLTQRRKDVSAFDGLRDDQAEYGQKSAGSAPRAF